MEDGIYLENKGKGRQCFIKTEFALQGVKRQLDVILIEEPENHLSHTNMRLLVKKIEESQQNKQLFITTHNSLICSRLGLRNTFLVNSTKSLILPFNSISTSTSRFFIKAPDNNILEFILSKKMILVEGDAEFILMENFYKKEIGKNLEESGVHIISVDGTSFPRYLDIAKLLKIQTVVIRDNDGDYETNCLNRYKNYTSEDYIMVFSETDNSISTFEISIFMSNQTLCKELFKPAKKTVQEYMIVNKTESALKLLEREIDVVVPNYIKEAIQWINN